MFVFGTLLFVSRLILVPWMIQPISVVFIVSRVLSNPYSLAPCVPLYTSLRPLAAKPLLQCAQIYA